MTGNAERAVENETGGVGDGLRASAAGMIGGQQVVADGGAECEHAAGLDLGRIGAERADGVTKQLHAPVVHPAQPFGDDEIAPGPAADGQVDGQQSIVGEGELSGEPGPCCRGSRGGWSPAAEVVWLMGGTVGHGRRFAPFEFIGGRHWTPLLAKPASLL